MIVSNRLIAKAHSAQIVNSLFKYYAGGYHLVRSGKSEASDEQVNSLYKLCGSTVQLSRDEQSELREIFHRYNLNFDRLWWTKMKLKPEFYMSKLGLYNCDTL